MISGWSPIDPHEGQQLKGCPVPVNVNVNTASRSTKQSVKRSGSASLFYLKQSAVILNSRALAQTIGCLDFMSVGCKLHCKTKTFVIGLNQKAVVIEWVNFRLP